MILITTTPVVQITIDRAKSQYPFGIRMQDIGESLSLLVVNTILNRFGMDGRSMM